MAFRWISMETGGLERRLEAVPQFAATIPMVGAAVPAARALEVADETVRRSKRVLAHQIHDFRRTIHGAPRDAAALSATHRRFTSLRHRFHALLSTVDIFSDALTQRAEHRIGVLLRGLDALAQDGMRTRVSSFVPPPIVCYLDRGVGGAVRRAFTRLPGGERNAIALIRLPRERLSGIGLASLLHEVGHQGVALLRLDVPYRRALHVAAASDALAPDAAAWWASKLTELLPDAWACAKLGASATLGLFSALSSLSRFVFHDNLHDPHPMPYLRGLFSAALGARLFPDPIWSRLDALWRALNPLPDHPSSRAIEMLADSVQPCAALIAAQRPRELGFMSLVEAIGEPVAPASLRAQLDVLLERLRVAPTTMRPCLGLAVVGIAHSEGHLASGEEHELLDRALRSWAETQTV
jgi:hypothetical protein